MNALALTHDLTIHSAAHGSGKRTGVAVRVVDTADRLVDEADANPAVLVVLDLETPNLDVAEVVARLHDRFTPPKRIVAFGPHVHRERLEAARKAGCDEVLSRGQFSAGMDEIIGWAAFNADDE
jgi:CheY-like chemotaxis protein